MGGGKSTVCIMDLLARAVAGAAQRPAADQVAIVRNTSGQLMSTVKPLIDEWLVSMPTQEHGAPLGTWRLTPPVTFEIRAKGRRTNRAVPRRSSPSGC